MFISPKIHFNELYSTLVVAFGYLYKEIRIKVRAETWIDTEIIELMQERDRALFNANRNKSDNELRKI